MPYETLTLEPLLAQYKALRDEIQLRVTQHTQIVFFKMVALGTAASFAAEKSQSLEKATGTSLREPTRLHRRFQLLRGWSHGEKMQVPR